MSGNAWDDLTEALALLRHHATNTHSPFHCEHDTLWVMAFADLDTRRPLAGNVTYTRGLGEGQRTLSLWFDAAGRLVGAGYKPSRKAEVEHTPARGTRAWVEDRITWPM